MPHSGEDDQEMKSDVKNGKFQLVCFTPKSLIIQKRWREVICSDNYQKRIRGLVIDEAHTIKKWLAIIFIVSCEVLHSQYYNCLMQYFPIIIANMCISKKKHS